MPSCRHQRWYQQVHKFKYKCAVLYSEVKRAKLAALGRLSIDIEGKGGGGGICTPDKTQSERVNGQRTKKNEAAAI